MDKRDGNLSVDRLGVHKFEQSVVEFLYPLCEAMATKGNTKFQGWVPLKVGDLKTVVRKTLATDENNPYHAEIDRSKHLTPEARRSLAFELCHFAEKHDLISRS